MHTIEKNEIQAIITRACGSPPDREKLKYCIWLNQNKYDFYSRCPFPRRGKYNDSALECYQAIVRTAQGELEKIDSQLKLEI